MGLPPMLNPSQFHQLRRLFWKCLELPIHRRAGCLAALRNSVDPLVFTHLCQLLEAYADAGAFLGDPGAHAVWTDQRCASVGLPRGGITGPVLPSNAIDLAL